MNFTAGCWALVTGASSGLGVEFAKHLVDLGFNVALTARRAQELHELAAELRDRSAVLVEVFPADLSIPGAAASLVAALDAQGIAPQVLINNAASGWSGTFLDQQTIDLAGMLAVDVVALSELTSIIGKRMLAARHGYILLVAGVASHFPTPTLAAYSAAKSYVQSLGEALQAEVGDVVGVTVVSPSYMETGFSKAAGFVAPTLLSLLAVSPAKVATKAITALFARKSAVNVGIGSKLVSASTHFLPRKMMAKLGYRVLSKNLLSRRQDTSMTAHMRNIVLIGPQGAGKGTIARELGPMLHMDRVSLDDPQHPLFARALPGFPAKGPTQPFMAWYHSIKPFEITSVENHMAAAQNAVVDFGAGYSSYVDSGFFQRAQRALANAHVVLLLPSIDLDVCEATLHQRNNNPDVRELNAHLLADPSNRRLANVVIYCNGKTPREIALEVKERLAL